MATNGKIIKNRADGFHHLQTGSPLIGAADVVGLHYHAMVTTLLMTSI